MTSKHHGFTNAEGPVIIPTAVQMAGKICISRMVAVALDRGDRCFSGPQAFSNQTSWFQSESIIRK